MLLLHLAMGDLANQENDDELWAGDDYLATKARISVGSVRRHRAQMVADGYLEVVEAGGGRGKRHCVRLLKPAQFARVSEDAKPAQTTPQTRAIATLNARNRDAGLLINPRERKEQNLAAAPPRRPTDDPLVAHAHRLTVLAFEQPVKPELRDGGKGAFPAAMRIIERVLRSGKSCQQVERAIVDGVEVWTLAGMQTAIAHSNPRRRSAPGRDSAGLSLTDLATLAHVTNPE
jgi:hypothetical protein